MTMYGVVLSLMKDVKKSPFALIRPSDTIANGLKGLSKFCSLHSDRHRVFRAVINL